MVNNLLTTDIIDIIRREEAEANSKVNKLLNIYSVIKTTRELASARNDSKIYPETFIIKRNRLFDGMILFIVAGLFTFFLISVFKKDNNINFYFYTFAFLFLLFCYYAFYKNLTLKNINYSIILTKKKLVISEKEYLWTEIQEIFIVYRPQGKVTYLIIYLKDGSHFRYHISNFITFTRSEKKIASIIEAFR